MMHTSCFRDGERRGWDRVGRAAERFASRVARDAAKFAGRIQAHTSEFADDVRRDWSRRHAADRDVRDEPPSPDMRRIFEDVRGVLADIVDGVDEFIARTFPDAAEASAEAAAPGEATAPGKEEATAPGKDAETSGESWIRVVANRDATCASCVRPIGAGDETYVRRVAGAPEFRCAACGAPGGAS